MTKTRPFTFVAVCIFLAMAVVHIYRIAAGFDIIVGTTPVPMSISWIALAITALFAVMLFRESRS